MEDPKCHVCRVSLRWIFLYCPMCLDVPMLKIFGCLCLLRTVQKNTRLIDYLQYPARKPCHIESTSD